MPAELVRVTDPVSKAQITITAGRAKRLNLTPLQKPATDRYGLPLPAKPATNPPSAPKPRTPRKTTRKTGPKTPKVTASGPQDAKPSTTEKDQANG